MKTFREIAEMHYASEPTNEVDKQYRQNRVNALEKLLTEQLSQPPVSGELPLPDTSNREHKELMRKLYPKDNSKQFRR